MKRPRILFYVQHLLGIGHIKRASLLVKAWVDAGFTVNVVSGGEPVEQFGFHQAEVFQLPAVKAADAKFSALVDSDENPLTEEFKRVRCEQLLQVFSQTEPDILVIENYPFGRRQLRWELKPLLLAARKYPGPAVLEYSEQLPVKGKSFSHKKGANPIVICSIRDILQGRKPERIDETVALLDQYFDYVMVHGDESFIPLQDSFPKAVQLSDKLIYTGYVSEAVKNSYQCRDLSDSGLQGSGSAGSGMESNPFLPGEDAGTADAVVEDELIESSGCSAGSGEVLVSAGGGAVGFELMKMALVCKNSSSLSHLTWRLLLGPNFTDSQKKILEGLADTGCILEPIRDDFYQLLKQCKLSISQAGYNTVMDILTAECPSVLVPFEGSGETEQLYRSRRLAEMGRCEMVLESELDREHLVAAIDRAVAGRTDNTQCFKDKNSYKLEGRENAVQLRNWGDIRLNGAENSAIQLEKLWQERQQQNFGNRPHV